MLMMYVLIIPFWLAAVGGSQVRLILRDVTSVVARFLGGPLGTTVKRRNKVYINLILIINDALSS